LEDSVEDTPIIRVTPSEAGAGWEKLLNATRCGERVVIGEGGEVIAALVPEREYQAIVRATGLTRSENGREAYLSALDAVHARNRDLDPRCVEQDVADAIEVIRAETRASDRALFERFGDLADEELVNVVTSAVRAMRAEARERSGPATLG